MKIISHGMKSPAFERLQCPLCECTFELQVSDLYNMEYTFKGKVGYVNCPECNAKLKIYEQNCTNPSFRIWFSVPEFVPKHIL